MSGAVYIAHLADGLSISELPLDNRSDKWWDRFWQTIGIREAERTSCAVNKKTKGEE